MTARRTKGKEREELIVEAATQAIVERGLANVRIADIAERAGMTPGHVTYYFPSKIDLLMRAISASEEALTIEGFTGGVGGTGPDASGGGSAIVIQMLQQTSAGPAIATSASSSRYAARTASK